MLFLIRDDGSVSFSPFTIAISFIEVYPSQFCNIAVVIKIIPKSAFVVFLVKSRAVTARSRPQ